MNEWAADQRHVDTLYAIVERRQAAAQQARDEALAERAAGAEAMLHREIRVTQAQRELSSLRAADSGLCFGRMDDDDSTVYLGRIGLFDEERPEPLLLDWRAPAARPFYCATPNNPMGILRRRHFRLSGRTIEQAVEESLDGSHSVDQALLTALESPRGEVMRDIVGTIQADQDGIIREPADGIVVIEGGPGTGKTSVAMHRIAYLLYAEHDTLVRRGVLMVGPSTRFLRYISQVLPSLGETGVVFATPAELFPGVDAGAAESPAARRAKGDRNMIGVLRRAVADRQALPEDPMPVELDDVTVWLTEPVCARARAKARASGRRHNPARAVFRKSLLSALTDAAVERIGADLLEPADVLDVHDELAGCATFTAAVDALWPELTPQRLLAELYTSRERIAAATPDWPAGDRALLYRVDGQEWTVPDAALLDEAAELLGPVRRERPASSDVAYAEYVLAGLDHGDDDGEQVRPADVVDPELLAERYAEPDHRTAAERGAVDREWTFGHVVVDEAQELSPMQWRVLLRRCPVKSMTLAGDRAQCAGAYPWRTALADEPVRVRTLDTNYRVPRPIMELAACVVPEARVPASFREGEPPWAVPAEQVDLGALIARERRRAEPGTLAVITAEPRQLPPTDAAVFTPAQVKGLEFDTVLVVEPAALADPAELYVALTRPTKRLGIVHTGPLPDSLAGYGWPSREG